MKTPFDSLIQKAEDFVEGIGDDVEDAVYDLRDSFAVESVRAGIVMALVGVQKFPFKPSGFVVGLPIPGTTGTIDIVVMGIRDRIDELIHYAKEPPKNKKEILHFFFAFAPTRIEVVPEIDVSVFGYNVTLGKGGVIIEGSDVLECLEQLITE